MREPRARTACGSWPGIGKPRRQNRAVPLKPVEDDQAVIESEGDIVGAGPSAVRGLHSLKRPAEVVAEKADGAARQRPVRQAFEATGTERRAQRLERRLGQRGAVSAGDAVPDCQDAERFHPDDRMATKRSMFAGAVEEHEARPVGETFGDLQRVAEGKSVAEGLQQRP